MTFHPVYTSMYDRSFSELPVFAQAVEFYIRTGPQRASEGLFRFNPAAAAYDLGMEHEDVETAIQQLEDGGRPFIYDRNAGVLLDESALKDNPLGKRDADWNEGPRDKRIKGALSKLKSLPPTPLLKHLYSIAGRYSPQLAIAMREEEAFDLPEVDTDAYFDIEKGLKGLKPLHATKPLKPRVEKSSYEMEKSEPSIVPIKEALNAEEIAS